MAHYDVIVIGLGCAGVTAATTLAKAGKRVLGLEAQDRIGGRIKTVKFGDGVVEEGAEWIHGTVNSRTYSVGIQNNIPLLEQDIAFQIFKSDGLLADEDLMNELIGYCFEIGKADKNFEGGLGDFITEKLTSYIQENYPDLLNDKDFLLRFLDLLNLIVCNYESSNDWNDVRSYSPFKRLDGHQNVSWHQYGYETLFDIMMNTYNNGAGLPSLDIKLSSPVTRIDWASGVTKVSCQHGTYTANNVIVTVSLGVLKARHESLFNPGLPQEKIEAIERISFGVMDKIILNFPQPWWPNEGWFYGFLWKSEDKARVAKEDYWITQIFGVSSPMGCKTALTFWTSGEAGKMVETLPEELVRQKCMELVRKFMGKTYNIPEPTDMIRSTWATNPYTLGSYSFDNRIALPEDRINLSSPLISSNNRVYFAGEATEINHYSSAHGACESGYKVAEEILNTLERKSLTK